MELTNLHDLHTTMGLYTSQEPRFQISHFSARGDPFLFKDVLLIWISIIHNHCWLITDYFEMSYPGGCSGKSIVSKIAYKITHLHYYHCDGRGMMIIIVVEWWWCHHALALTWSHDWICICIPCMYLHMHADIHRPHYLSSDLHYICM